MSLSNTAVPRYYGAFRDSVIRREIPVCREILMEMNRIDDLIENPAVYYDDEAVEGWIKFCEAEMTLTDGSDFVMLDSFKLWGNRSLAGTILSRELCTNRSKTDRAGDMSRRELRSGL